MRRIYLALILALVFHAAVFFINPSAKRTDAERPSSSLTIKFNTIYTSKPSEQIFSDIVPEPQILEEPQQPPEIISAPELVENKPETKSETEIIRKKESKPMLQKQEVLSSSSEPRESVKESEFMHHDNTAADDSSLINIPNREEKTTSPVIIIRPRYKENTAPPYPAGALRRKLQGNVNLKVFVKEDGTPGDVILLESSGHSILDDAAIKAVLKWRFEPGLENSRPVAMWVEVPIKFFLE